MITTLSPIEFDEATFLQDGNVTLPPRVVTVSNLLAALSTGELSDDRNIAITKAAETALRCTRDELLLLMASVFELRTEVQRFLNET